MPLPKKVKENKEGQKMCDFCSKHGEGKKWYLQAKNFVSERGGGPRRLTRLAGQIYKMEVKGISWLLRAPKIARLLLKPLIRPIYRTTHFGQVVPIEDVELILDIVGTIVRLPCICRWVTKRKEERVCFGVVVGGLDSPFLKVIDPKGWAGPEIEGLEVVGKKEALKLMREFEYKGLVHTIWTYETPFIGSICNCKFGSCVGLDALQARIKIIFRGEYLAYIDLDLCTSCGQCEKICPFQAISLSRKGHKYWVNPLLCFGCGICKSVCPSTAIRLLERLSVPVASNLW